MRTTTNAPPLRNAAPLVSVFIIIVTLLPYPPTASLSARSQFTLRSAPGARRRRHASAPYARSCSAAARAHFNERFARAQRALQPLRPLSASSSRNRFFMSSIPVEVGDGLGHRTCILNYELLMSMLLRLSYSHRVSTYGSLSATRRTAVDALFGWGASELTRDELLARGCAHTRVVNDSCELPAQHVQCARVRPRSRGGLFDQTVMIPAYVSDCLLQAAHDGRAVVDEQQCASLFSTFVSAYSEPNTLFQLQPTRCFRDYLYTNFSRTRDWFAHKFWQRGDDGRGNAAAAAAAAAGAAHTLLERERARIQVAMHVRRGDFFNYSNRVLIADATFVDVAGRLSEALDDIVGATVPITVHVFSEGVTVGGERVKDNHDTSKMEAVYVDERGNMIRDASHWQRLFREHGRWRRRRRQQQQQQQQRDVQVKTHIATDTLQAVELMLHSDFFIGSISGLSVQVVRHIGRGLMLLPVHDSEIGEEEQIVAFDYGRHGYDSFLQEDKLYTMVARSVRRNRLGCSVW